MFLFIVVGNAVFLFCVLVVVFVVVVGLLEIGSVVNSICLVVVVGNIFNGGFMDGGMKEFDGM